MYQELTATLAYLRHTQGEDVAKEYADRHGFRARWDSDGTLYLRDLSTDEDAPELAFR